jgi:hypothetical protein
MVGAEEACHDGWMSERFTMRVAAGRGTVLAEGALDGQIGETVTIWREHDQVEGTVVAAEITEAGGAAMVTVEVPDGTLPRPPLAGCSIGREPGV